MKTVHFLTLVAACILQVLTTGCKPRLDNPDPAVRLRAIQAPELTNETVLAAVAVGDNDAAVRRAACTRLQSQNILEKVAVESRYSDVRGAAVARIAADALLLRRAREDSSPTVRAAAVCALHQPVSILLAATGGYYRDVRLAAYDRLVELGDKAAVKTANDRLKLLGDRTALKKSLIAQRVFIKPVKANDHADESKLAEAAIHGDSDIFCLLAVSELRDQDSLKRVFLESSDHEVVKIAFSRLNETTLAEITTGAASDPALRLAAACKVGRQSWGPVFRAATGNPKALGDAVAAVSLFKKAPPDAKAAVEQACLVLIGRGDESRIPEMTDLLEEYGSKQLAEDYINCGQPDLKSAAHTWAREHGYYISPGGGSHRAGWGTGKGK